MGPAEIVHDLAVTFQVLDAGLEPLAGGAHRTTIVRIEPTFISGRRIVHNRRPPELGGSLAMDFDVSEEMSTILEMARAFVDTEVVPLEGEMLHGDAAALDAGVAKAQRKVREDGVVGAQPSGGVRRARSQLVEHGLVSEVLGRSPLGHYVFGAQAPDAGNIEILHKYGTPTQKASAGSSRSRAARSARASR